MTLTIAPENILLVALSFARIGILAMLFPLIGERFVPTRIRLVFALFLSGLLAPVIKPSFGSVLSVSDRLVPVLIGEILIGLVIGLIMRMIMALCDLLGQFVTQSLGLSLGEVLNPSLGQATPVLGTFFTLLMLVSFFALEGHHAVIRAMIGSYHALPPAETINFSDLGMLAVSTLTHAFETALRLAAPFLLFGILINFGLGLVAKLMPNVPVTFLAVPISVLAGLFILFIVVDPLTHRFVDDLMHGLATFAPD